MFESICFDFRGPVVDEQNAIATDAELSDQIQTSYFAALSSDDPLFAQFSTGISYSDGNVIDTTRLGTSGSDNIDHSNNTIRTNDLIFGLAGNDTITTGVGDDYIYGGDGEDYIEPGSGNDVIWGGMMAETGRDDGVDTVRYTSAPAGIAVTIGSSATVQDGEGGIDTLHSVEIIEGSSHDDILVLQSLAPAIVSGLDYIDLGGANDTIDISNLTGAITVDLWNPSYQTVTLDGSTLVLSNVEFVVGAGPDDTVRLGATVGGADTGGGNDTIYLSGGEQTIAAGDGYDTLDLSSAISGSRISMSAGSALVRGSGTSSFDSIEEVVGGSFSNLIYGGGRGTVLRGGSGVNYIEGSGSDILQGSTGDTYFHAMNGATVISGAGNDYIEASGSAPITIEFGVGSGHDMLGSFFQSLPNGTLESDPWRDRRYDTILLSGLTKDDIELVWDYVQTGGTDTLGFDDYYRQGDAAIRIKSTGETLYLGTLLYHFSHFLNEFELEFNWYNSFDYKKMGSGETNDTDYNDPRSIDVKIFSFDGVTKLDIFDLFDLETVASQALPQNVLAASDLLQRLAAGTDTGVTGGTSGADNLTGTSGSDDILAGGGNDTVDGGDGNDFLRGGDGSDIILAGAGDDSLDGGSGDDDLTGLTGSNILIGGSGDDVYRVNTCDVIIELPGEGQDMIRAYSSYTLAAGVSIETITTPNSAKTTSISLTGNEYDNLIVANAGANTLSGGDGDDRLRGMDGDDTLIGGAGSDVLTGGTGNDLFVIESTSDSTPLARDVIADFVSGEKIDLSQIDANIGVADDQAFTFIGTAQFSGAAGELRYQIASGNGNTYIYGDTNGDGVTDLLILLTGSYALSATDFAL